MLPLSRMRRGLPHTGIIGLVPKPPKKKCCSDKPACKRCPLRMMKKGTLPAGYTVKKRKLVKIKNDKKTKTNVAA